MNNGFVSASRHRHKKTCHKAAKTSFADAPAVRDTSAKYIPALKLSLFLPVHFPGGTKNNPVMQNLDVKKNVLIFDGVVPLRVGRRSTTTLRLGLRCVANANVGACVSTRRRHARQASRYQQQQQFKT